MEAGKEKVHSLPGKDSFSPFLFKNLFSKFVIESKRMKFHREMIIRVSKFDLIVAKIPGVYHLEMG